MYPGEKLSFQWSKDGKPSPYSIRLQDDGKSRAGVRIKAVAVFDTVGGLFRIPR